ncbi:TetR/AcrR family transcriptional regulator [Catenulispora sp. GAS73]|uniref:TetR/AcrR family transcriptional regulator n=1 Tax=Catenulispora sp. GAS73 TaxID=3156269 RepID=UPI0035146C30
MSDPGVPPSRDAVRARLVDVAAGLLAAQGPEAVTTRSVALAAGVQAPTIYRLFGDKNGLLEAVAENGFANYVAQKHPVDADDDPVEGLHAGWNLHIGFGLANPALFRLIHTAMRTPDGRSAVEAIEAGANVLRQRVTRVARAGRLRVPEQRAVDLIHAAGTGVVFTLIDQPAETRDESLADLAWEGVCATILTGEHTGERTGEHAAAPAAPATAAVTLRAALPDLVMFTPHERALFGDWLGRVVDAEG